MGLCLAAIAAQSIFAADAFFSGRPHKRDNHSIAASRLRMIERLVRRPEDVTGGEAMIGKRRDPQGKRNLAQRLAIVENIQTLYFLTEMFRTVAGCFQRSPG